MNEITKLEGEELDAAGDVELHAGDVRGEVGAEEGDRVGDVDAARPGRRSAVRRIIRSFISAFPKLNASVPMIPGTMAFAVMPCRAPSSASVFVSPIRPAFVVE